ncbi:tyrosine-type recombinase/integrase [Hyphomonas pacifica]|nr:site-specific integrase [Hyphomonas pacifica]
MAELRRRFKGTRCDTDRHGNVRWYALDPNGRKIRLRGEPGSDHWLEQYHAARTGEHIPDRSPTAGTLAHLIRQWRRSPDWDRLADATKKTRGRILDDIERKSGDLPVSAITAANIRAGRNMRASTPAAANNHIKILSALFAWGMENELCAQNPARGVKKLPMRKGGFHSWTVEDCLAFEARWPLGTLPRTAYALALYLGLRRQDIPKLGPQHVTKDGFMRVPRQKNRGRSEAPQEVWICPPLQEALDAFEMKGLTYLQTEQGKARSVAGLGNSFREWCDAAGLPHCSAHGLRKAVAARMREAGCSIGDIQSVTDQETSAEVDRYTRDAAKKSASKRALQKTFGEQNVPPVGGDNQKVGRN